MRFKSEAVDGFQIYAVAGTNTVSFAVDATPEARKGLLGFTVERYDPATGKRTIMPGFKVFRSIIPDPKPRQMVSTYDQPMQGLLWDDFTRQPDRTYEYCFQPLRGTPSRLDRSARPVTIEVRTEPLFTKDDHDVFFNRGVASSQAYERAFGNLPPDRLTPESKQQAAIEWLARDLDDAMLRFIENAGEKDTLLCCFYEFHYEPVLDALAKAARRVRTLKIIIDAKQNAKTGRDGKMQEPFPREVNLRAIKAAGIPMSCIVKREANPSEIQHNKFMVLLKGAARTPIEVWTGSTNVSLGGVTGQTNVGHWVHNRAAAKAFAAYWELLASNPGSKKGDDRSEATAKKRAYREAVEALGSAPATSGQIQEGTTPIFGPRTGLGVLELYVELIDQANAVACITLAFGINDLFRNPLSQHTVQDSITFLLLEEEDKPRKNSTKPFVALNARNNVYKAWGAYIKDAVYQWASETNTKRLGINRHVAYIHSKFLLRDPLGEDPIVVTGSANFSAASTKANDENMIVIRGNQRVADIYFTEFNRLWNHYYFRSVVESTGEGRDASARFLEETPEAWQEKYRPGSLKTKRLAIYTGMMGFTNA